MRNLITRIILILWVAVLPVSSYGETTIEGYTVKAVFMYNFTKFIEWPEEHKTTNICVLGKDPFGKALTTLEKQKAPEIKVRNKTYGDDLEDCHVLFISESEKFRLEHILAIIEGKPILTISEIKDFIEKDGMIGFINDKNRVKLEMNAKSMLKNKLKVEPMLLEIARKVIVK